MKETPQPNLPTKTRVQTRKERNHFFVPLSLTMLFFSGCSKGFCTNSAQKQRNKWVTPATAATTTTKAVATSCKGYHDSCRPYLCPPLFVVTEPTDVVEETKHIQKVLYRCDDNKDYGDNDDDEDDGRQLRHFFQETSDAAFQSRRQLAFRPETGKLELGRKGPTLLEGLSPDEWSAVEPTATVVEPVNDDSRATSIFLQPKSRDNKARHEHRLPLGNLVGCQRLVACARLNRYWMGPVFGTNAKDIPHDTQFLLVQVSGYTGDGIFIDNEQELYALVLPMVHGGFRCTIQGNISQGEDGIEVRCFSEGGTPAGLPEGMNGVYVAMGEDPFQLLQQGFREVSEAIGSFRTLDQKSLPPSVNNFGWCTWDAFYSKVTPEGILEGVQALKEAGVPPRTVILDDGWQIVEPMPQSWKDLDGDCTVSTVSIDSTLSASDRIFNKFASAVTDYYVRKVEDAPHGSFHNRMWRLLAKSVLRSGLWNFFDSETDFARQLGGFEPNFKFEKTKACRAASSRKGIGSLKDLVSELKDSLGIHHIYCWHAIHGYWRGISTDLGKSIGIDVLQVNPQASNHVLEIEPQAAFDPPSLFGVGVIPKKEHIDTFYEHIHKPLVEAGVDGVKVDVQSGVTASGSGLGYGTPIARLYTEAMEASVSQHFQVHDPKSNAIHCINCMCHSTENLYRYRETAIARASEDFFPDKPESHSVHLVNVAYNSLFLGEICLPDWDMFHSKHESAALHAAARAIGGCPVYVSDVPGEHDTDLLKKLVLPDGSVLRASKPGRPTRDTLFTDVGQDRQTALKIWNVNSGSNGGVVGAFHVQGVAWNFDKHKNEVVNKSPQPIVVKIKPFDVETLRTKTIAYSPDQTFALFQHRNQNLHVVKGGYESVEVTLTSHDWDIFTVVPIANLEKVQWGPIGLSNMLNSGGSLQNVQPLRYEGEDQARVADVSVRGPGTFVSHCYPAPSSVQINGVKSTSFSYDMLNRKLTIELSEEGSNKPHDVRVTWKSQ